MKPEGPGPKVVFLSGGYSTSIFQWIDDIFISQFHSHKGIRRLVSAGIAMLHEISSKNDYSNKKDIYNTIPWVVTSLTIAWKI